MKLQCQGCNEPISADNINITLMVAKCDRCHSVFNFSTHLKPDISITDSPVSRKPKEISQPKQVSIFKEGMTLNLVQNWFSLKYLFLLFFCIAWDSFLIFWYAIALSEGAPWIMSVFPLAHVAVGVGLSYYTLAGLLNRSIVSVNQSEFSIRHGPLPWIGNITLRSSEIDQLYCQEEYNRGKNGVYYTYQLSALLKNGRKIKLLSNLDSAEVVLYMERQIEDWLSIKDRPVVGEMSH